MFCLLLCIYMPTLNKIYLLTYYTSNPLHIIRWKYSFISNVYKGVINQVDLYFIYQINVWSKKIVWN